MEAFFAAWEDGHEFAFPLIHDAISYCFPQEESRKWVLLANIYRILNLIYPRLLTCSPNQEVPRYWNARLFALNCWLEEQAQPPLAITVSTFVPNAASADSLVQCHPSIPMPEAIGSPAPGAAPQIIEPTTAPPNFTEKNKEKKEEEFKQPQTRKGRRSVPLTLAKRLGKQQRENKNGAAPNSAQILRPSFTLLSIEKEDEAIEEEEETTLADKETSRAENLGETKTKRKRKKKKLKKGIDISKPETVNPTFLPNTAFRMKGILTPFLASFQSASERALEASTSCRATIKELCAHTELREQIRIAKEDFLKNRDTKTKSIMIFYIPNFFLPMIFWYEKLTLAHILFLRIVGCLEKVLLGVESELPFKQRGILGPSTNEMGELIGEFLVPSLNILLNDNLSSLANSSPLPLTSLVELLLRRPGLEEMIKRFCENPWLEGIHMKRRCSKLLTFYSKWKQRFKESSNGLTYKFPIMRTLKTTLHAYSKFLIGFAKALDQMVKMERKSRHLKDSTLFDEFCDTVRKTDQWRTITKYQMIIAVTLGFSSEKNKDELNIDGCEEILVSLVRETGDLFKRFA